MARRTAAALALAVLSLSWAGCDADEKPPPHARPTADPTVSAEKAQRTFSPMMSVVSASIAAAVPQPPPSVTHEVIYYDGDLGSCAYSARVAFPGVVFGTDLTWNAVRVSTEDVLQPMSFSLSDQLDIPGGYNGFDATAPDGTVIQVRSKTAEPSTVSITAPVTGSCPPDGAGQTLEPLDR